MAPKSVNAQHIGQVHKPDQCLTSGFGRQKLNEAERERKKEGVCLQPRCSVITKYRGPSNRICYHFPLNKASAGSALLKMHGIRDLLKKHM